MADNLGWQDWVAYAEDNYLGATDLLETRGATAILLLHQAIEKYFKAVLVQQSVLPDRSHDLVMLLRLVEPSVVFEDDLWKAARELNYLLPRARYPNGAQKITPEAVRKAFEFAIALRALALAKLSS
jgi:HEPN domain-containing protein